MWLIMKEQDSLGISDGAIALTYLLWQLICMVIKGCCMHNGGFMMMNQTAQPKASKCIWQSGFTTSMNHQTFGHASSKSRMIQDSVLQPNQIPLTVFQKPILRRWRCWPQSIIRIVLCLPPTLSQSSQSFFASCTQSNHLSGIFEEKVYTLWTCVRSLLTRCNW